mgnify:FL=1
MQLRKALQLEVLWAKGYPLNYAELSAALVAYTENTGTDFADNIPVFVKQAETRIYNTVQLPALRRNMTGVATASNKYLSAPNDFLSVFSMAVIDGTGEYQYLLDKDVNYIRAAYPTPTSTGVPKYYAIFGPQSSNATELSFILGPTPDDDYEVELHYFYYPESIVTAGTTWLGDNFDPVLLYGSLVEAYTYMKGETELLALYGQKYMEALAILKELGDGKQRQDAYRSGQTRIAVR